MLDVVNGVSERGRELTSTHIYRAGAIIPQDLPKEFVQRWDAGDEFARQTVEYVEGEDVTDDEGNTSTVYSAAARPENSGEAPSGDEVQRAESAEGELTELRSKVSKLQNELGSSRAQGDADKQRLQSRVSELEGQLGDAEEAATASTPVDYSKLSSEALKAEVEHRKLKVSGSGASGNVVKSDQVKALQEDDAKS